MREQYWSFSNGASPPPILSANVDAVITRLEYNWSHHVLEENGKYMNNSTNIIDVTDADFEEEVIEGSYETTVVVDFWAPWCGPCRMLGPILERLASEPGSNFILAKLNVDENPAISLEYGVHGIPAVKAFRDGAVVDEFVGALPEARVRAFLDRVAPDDDLLLMDEVEALLSDLEWSEAEETLRDAAPSPIVSLGLAKALLGQGEGCEAKELLENIVEASVYSEAQRLLPLANYLCEVDGESDSEELTTIEAQYRHVAELLRRNNMEAALDGLLEVLREDKKYRNGEVRDVIIALFALLGDHNPLTRRYRSELAVILF